MRKDLLREFTLTIYGNPISKKNSQRLVPVKGRIIPLPSKAYAEYEANAKGQLLGQIGEPEIDYPVNISCVYYMGTRRKCDLVNMIEASLDILVKARVIADDNYTIVARHDNCGVFYDKVNPRVEVTITELLTFEP